MLVLTRKLGQKIYINDIEIIVLSQDRNQIKIGITAPLNYDIYREEIKNKEKKHTIKVNNI